jgi:mRNA interferase RelE/StbE
MYTVEVLHRAARSLLKLPLPDRARIAARIDGLAENPRPDGCKKLTGSADAYRIRSGNYRIVYTVDDVVRVITVEKIAHRREVYR